MPQEIDVEGLVALLEQGEVELIEVLPEREYNEEHLAGAINLPLKKFSAEALSHLDRVRPTVVYCWDAL